MEIYQDIYSQGKVVQSGKRECSERYDTLKKVFSEYRRPFSILDIGANFGYFSVRAAEDFGATSVMVQPTPQSEVLKQTCLENPNLNLTVLSKQTSGKDLLDISKCERFDIVLALNVLHHIEGSWQVAAEAIMDMGDTIIFENPPENDTGTCGKALIKPLWDFFKNLPHEHLGYFSRHTDPNAKSEMIKLQGTKKQIKKSYINYDSGKPPAVNFESNFSQRKVTKTLPNGETQIYDWVNGINLQTFIEMGGYYPTKEQLIQQVSSRDIKGNYEWNDSHGDIKPWNLIVNGSDLHLIDMNGKNHWSSSDLRTDADGLTEILNELNKI